MFAPLDATLTLLSATALGLVTLSVNVVFWFPTTVSGDQFTVTTGGRR